jgi:HAE1 family hydrophobic/amphiphilic exporter-1
MYAVGLPVLGGMLAASIIGVFMIPMLYVVFQGLREWTSRGGRGRKDGDGLATAAPSPHPGDPA